MLEAKIRSASDLLHEHWHAGTRLDALPEEMRPRTRAEGYAIQALVERRSRFPLFGWKIAATSKAGQEHIAVDAPLAGRIIRERVIENGAACTLGGNLMRVAEPEFAFMLGSDIVPRRKPWSAEEAAEQVKSLHPAIEVPDSRFDRFCTVGAAQLIADNACAHLFVLGQAAPGSWRSIDLATHRVWGRIDGEEPRAGYGANVLGGPLIALAWLLSECSRHGMTLRSGQIVTTGTCMTPLSVGPGNRILGEFGELGLVSLAFSG